MQKCNEPGIVWRRSADTSIVPIQKYFLLLENGDTIIRQIYHRTGSGLVCGGTSSGEEIYIDPSTLLGEEE